MTTEAVYKIPASNLPRLQSLIAKLNTRAAKLGVEPVRLTVGPELSTSGFKSAPCRSRTVYHDVTVTGTTPKLAGYEFLATLDHTSEAGVVLRVIPGGEIPEWYRDAKPVCDHCGFNRIRKDTFVLRHDSGAFKQVGRVCLKDFLGGKDPHAIASWAQVLGAFADTLRAAEEEGWGTGGFGPTFYDTADYLAVVAAMIDKHGWVSRTAAREGTAGQATADRVNDWLNPPLVFEKLEDLAITDAHKALAERTIEWARGLREAKGNDINGASMLSDYEHNLTVILGSDALAIKNTGFAASAIPSYRRAVEREVERARASATSGHFGTPGVRADYRLTVVGVHVVEGRYGATHIYKFTDAAGNRAVWFSSRALTEFEPGTTWDLTATVKEHTRFRGIAETVITRAVVKARTEGVKVEEPCPF